MLSSKRGPGETNIVRINWKTFTESLCNINFILFYTFLLFCEYAGGKLPSGEKNLIKTSKQN